MKIEYKVKTLSRSFPSPNVLWTFFIAKMDAVYIKDIYNKILKIFTVIESTSPSQMTNNYSKK